MLLVIFVLSIFISFALPKSKGYFIYLILLGFIVFAFNTDTVDRNIYESRYTFWDEDYFFENTEPLYNMLIEKMNRFRYSFQFFIGFHAFVFLWSLYFYINRQSTSPSLTISLFYLGAFLFCVSMMRNSLAFSLQLLALHFLLQPKKNAFSNFCICVVYVSLTLVASLIHSSCFAFLIFLIVLFFDEKIIAKYFILATILMILVITSLKHFFLGLNVEKVEMVYDDMDRGGSIVIVMLLAIIRYLSCLMIIFVPYYFMNGYKAIDKKVLSINYLMFALMPILYISHDFGRFTYVLFLINICELSKLITKKNCMLFLIFVSLNFGYWSFGRAYFAPIVIRPLTNNLLFE